MMVRNFLRICHIGCALLLSVATLVPRAVATETGTGAQIDQFMAVYTRDLVKRLGPDARIEYSAPAIATSAETRPCAAPLAITAKDSGQSLTRLTLLVACGNEWSIYVPIDLNVYRTVVVSTRPLANGAVLTSADVELSSINIGQLTGTYLTALDEAVGMGVKRPLMPGRPIVAQQLEPPLLIRRGEAVMINAENSALAVKMPGTALTDGRRGEQIRIKNQATSRVIDARVVGPGQVTVPM